MDFGQAIRTLRKERDLTQTQLAERCFVSTNAVNAWENGRAYPPKGSVERLCKAFGVSVAYFMMASIGECDFPEDKRILYRTQFEPLRHELLSNQEP